MPSRVKIFLVADRPVVREGLAFQISQHHELVLSGQAADATEARQRIPVCRPDVVVVDPVFRNGNGSDLLRQLKAAQPGLRILVFSSQDERVYAERALRAGARGFLMQQEPSESLIAAIRRVRDGHVYLSEAMRSHLLDHFGLPDSADGLGIEQLTDRELEVFAFVGEGLQTRQIASRLHLSVKTVETYYERIKLRLRLDNFHELVRQSTLWVHGPHDGSAAPAHGACIRKPRAKAAADRSGQAPRRRRAEQR